MRFLLLLGLTAASVAAQAQPADTVASARLEPLPLSALANDPGCYGSARAIPGQLAVGFSDGVSLDDAIGLVSSFEGAGVRRPLPTGPRVGFLVADVGKGKEKAACHHYISSALVLYVEYARPIQLR